MVIFGDDSVRACEHYKRCSMLLVLFLYFMTYLQFEAYAFSGADDFVLRDDKPVPLSPDASFYNSFWTDNRKSVSYQSLAGGAYSVTWNGTGNFVAGKGWKPGSTSRVVKWNGTFAPNGYAYLSVYGWTTTPLIEFYIVENYHPDHEPAAPPDGEEIGNFTTDGSLYLIRTKMRVNKPSIQGTSTFRQVFSVRQDKRSDGSVTVSDHFRAWNASGLKTGELNYMIVATEGLNSSGKAEITVYS